MRAKTQTCPPYRIRNNLRTQVRNVLYSKTAIAVKIQKSMERRLIWKT